MNRLKRSWIATVVLSWLFASLVATPTTTMAAHLAVPLIRATFRLSVLGTLPAGQSLGLVLVPRTLRVGQTGFEFCGGVRPCRGNGAVEVRTFDFPAGTTLDYKFVRVLGDGTVQVFAKGTTTLTQDTTTSAVFSTDVTGNNQQPAGQLQPSQLPNTGAAVAGPMPRLQADGYASLAVGTLLFLGGVVVRRQSSVRYRHPRP